MHVAPFSTFTAVVDARGRPLRVFHGTGEAFDQFDTALAGQSSDHPTAELGIFFSVCPDVAYEFVPRDYGEEPSAPEEGANIRPAYLVMHKPYAMSAARFNLLAENSTGRKMRQLRAHLESLGHDGIHIKGNSRYRHELSAELAHDSWVVFRADQIYSAFDTSLAPEPVTMHLAEGEPRVAHDAARPRRSP